MYFRTVQDEVGGYLFTDFQLLLRQESRFIDELTLGTGRALNIGDFSPEGVDKVLYTPLHHPLLREVILTSISDLEKLANELKQEKHQKNRDLEAFLHWARADHEVNIEEFKSPREPAQEDRPFSNSYPLAIWKALVVNLSALHESLLKAIIKFELARIQENLSNHEQPFTVKTSMNVMSFLHEVKFDVIEGVSAYEIVKKHESEFQKLIALRSKARSKGRERVAEALENLEDTLIEIRMSHLLEYSEDRSASL